MPYNYEHTFCENLIDADWYASPLIGKKSSVCRPTDQRSKTSQYCCCNTVDAMLVIIIKSWVFFAPAEKQVQTNYFFIEIIINVIKKYARTIREKRYPLMVNSHLLDWFFIASNTDRTAGGSTVDKIKSDFSSISCHWNCEKYNYKPGDIIQLIVDHSSALFAFESKARCSTKNPCHLLSMLDRSHTACGDFSWTNCI